jgi:predicted PurR-regulated permease PerM
MLACAVIVVAGFHFAKEVLVPFAIAFLLAFLLSPLVARLKKLGLPRILAVIVAMAVALAIAAALVWVVVGQMRDIVEKLPQYESNLVDKFVGIRRHLDKATETVTKIAEKGLETRAEDPRPPQPVSIAESTSLFKRLAQPVGLVLSALGAVGIVLLFVALMLVQMNDMRDRLIRLAGNKLYTTTRAVDEAGAKVSRYLLLTSMINGAHGLCIGVGLSLIGVPNALLWGVLSALLRFIPYIGPWLAAAFPVTLALAVFPGWTTPLLTIGLILVLELISNNVVEPWVYGAGTGVSPGALLAATVFWTWLWGIPGLFLATPMTVCLAVIGKYVPPLGFFNVLLGDQPVLPPSARLYQRLLARDQDEASALLTAQLREKSLLEVYDETLIPAVILAERDQHQGTLDEQTQAFVVRAMNEIVEEADDWRPPKDEAEKRSDAARPQEPAETSATEDRPAAVKAICVAADDESDHVVAVMAAQVLRRASFDAEVIALATLTGELSDLVAQKGAGLVLISDVPPSGFAHVRYICKRLAARAPGMPLIVGVWGSNLDARKAADRLPEVGSLTFVTSLKGAVDRAQELLEELRLKIPRGAPAPRAHDVQKPLPRASDQGTAPSRPSPPPA